MLKIKIELPESFKPFFEKIQDKGQTIKEFCEQELTTEIESRNLDAKFKYFSPQREVT